MLTDKIAVQDLLAICKLKSIDHVVFSPGSRNAPLILSFAGNPSFKTISIPDERSAAFFALGMAQQLGKPVILSCTSGSAVLNYAPAIAEAYYQKIPLLIVTADRPNEWTDMGDGQTIRQFNVYNNYIKKSYELVQESNGPNDRWANRRKISEAIEIANNSIPGPVHINMPFREPLYHIASAASDSIREISKIPIYSTLAPEVLEELKNEWNSHSQKLIICGQLLINSRIQEYVDILLDDPSVCILTESTSNLFHEKLNCSIDRVITTFTDQQEKEFSPDLIISLGGAIVSKKIKAYLRKFPAKIHWHIGHENLFIDVFQALTHQIPTTPEQFLEQFLPIAFSEESNYQDKWVKKHQVTQKLHEKFLQNCEWSDLKAIDIILKHIPKASHLHMANSSPVRYVQLFQNVKGLNYYSNRGVSGIDGCSSTAAGASFVNKDIHTLITGDMAFFYDSNAFWNRHLGSNLKIIVINNQGGGIFRIIPGPGESGYLNEYFECNHPASIEYIAKAYKSYYFKATNTSELKKSLVQLYRSSDNDKPGVLEIVTPGKDNDIVLKKYFDFIKH